MKSTNPKTPMAFKIALLNILIGGMGFWSSLLFGPITPGVSQISIGLLLLGAGEYINNPPVKTTSQHDSDQEANQSRYFNRRRNVSGLGNLLDIGGILTVVAGAATLFF